MESSEKEFMKERRAVRWGKSRLKSWLVAVPLRRSRCRFAVDREMERERRARGPPPASRVALKNIPDITVRLLTKYSGFGFEFYMGFNVQR